MAAYQYPTPPPTISPKNEYLRRTSTSNQQQYTPNAQRLPAQESYSYSAAHSSPRSPSYESPWALTNPAPTPFELSSAHYGSDCQPQHYSLQDPLLSIQPPKRRNSPLISHVSPSNLPSNPPFSSSPKIQSPNPNDRQNSYPIGKSPPSSRKHTPPRPIYYSPTNPIPSPYSTSRPKPRPGFIKRILNKIEVWVRSAARWCRKNPIKAGLLTFIPVLGAAGLLKMLGGVGSLVGNGKLKIESMVQKSRKNVKDGEKARNEGKKDWGWGLDDFVGFNGSKGGPLDGMLRVVQMWVNHICRVTPSMVPRTMAIILELYFLELQK